MTIQQIHYFISVAENLSFTKAARKHFITQPALSRQISAMESELGFSLFVRNKTGIRLTNAGKFLLGHFKELSQAYEDAVKEAARLGSGRNGAIDFGRSSSFAFDLKTLQCISDFMSENSDVDLSVSNLSREALISSIENGELDAAFTYLDYAHQRSSGSGLRHMIIGIEAICIAVSKVSPLASQNNLILEDLQASRLIAVRLPSEAPPEIALNNRSLQLYLHGNPNPRIIYTDNVEDMTAQVESGIGLTFIPAGHPLCSSPLVRLFDAPDKTMQERVILWNQENANPVLLRFIAHAGKFFSTK